MKTKHLKWLWPLLLLPAFRQGVVAQTETPKDTVVISDTLRWTWTAKAGEEKGFTFAVKTPGRYRVCWGDGDMKDYGAQHGGYSSHRYVQEGSYKVMVFGIGTFPFEYTENALGIDMELVYVEGGTFTMGCTSEQGGDCGSAESPSHSVTLDGFYIGRYEVTQGQWKAVMGTTLEDQRDKVNEQYGGSYGLYGVGDDYPMYYVSWTEAVAFCDSLSKRTGRKYRLPTEAEWEYAARGGQNADSTKYAGSNTIGDVAWYDGNSGDETHLVGQKQPNGLGLYDMSGNVYEWCYDWYDSYSSSSVMNPQGPEKEFNRVHRGGSWGSVAGFCRVSFRFFDFPDYRFYYLGFRVAVLL